MNKLNKKRYDFLTSQFNIYQFLEKHLTTKEIDRLHEGIKYDNSKDKAFLDKSLKKNYPLSFYASFSYAYRQISDKGNRAKDSIPFVKEMQSFPNKVAPKLHFNTIFIGLNAGATAQNMKMDDMIPFENFHYNGLSKKNEVLYTSNAYLLHYALIGSEFEGSYITDAIKGFSTSNGKEMMNSLKALEKELKLKKYDLVDRFFLAFGDALKEEIKLLQLDNPKLIFLGRGDTMKRFMQVNGFVNAKSIKHYTAQGTQGGIGIYYINELLK